MLIASAEVVAAQEASMLSAMRAFNRPVAMRWRRVIAIARWGARIRLWRAAFTEVWLRPGGLGERALSERFEENKRVLTHHIVSH